MASSWSRWWPSTHIIFPVEASGPGSSPLRGLGIARAPGGPRHEHHPVSQLRDGGPALLAVHHPAVAVLDRARLQRGEVAPGIGLGVALAPDLLAGEHLGGIAPLLLL